MSLAIDIGHVIDEFRLDVRVTLGTGLTALVGPSGAGKTTILNVIAGVLKPDRAVVRLDAHVLADTGARVWLPAHRRRIGYVFQEPRLFPHFSVRQNLMYGRWFHKDAPGALPATGIIELLNLGPLLGRRPASLSGGEKQRVALGRALLSTPALLLLDEPLAAVDQAHRAEILPYLDRVRAERAVPTVYVTHTWAEVSGRAEHVVELRDGAVVFSGPAAEAARRRSI
jgi:molybdate transport system ATP-binding protein